MKKTNKIRGILIKFIATKHYFRAKLVAKLEEISSKRKEWQGYRDVELSSENRERWMNVRNCLQLWWQFGIATGTTAQLQTPKRDREREREE